MTLKVIAASFRGCRYFLEMANLYHRAKNIDPASEGATLKKIATFVDIVAIGLQFAGSVTISPTGKRKIKITETTARAISLLTTGLEGYANDWDKETTVRFIVGCLASVRSVGETAEAISKELTTLSEEEYEALKQKLHERGIHLPPQGTLEKAEYWASIGRSIAESFELFGRSAEWFLRATGTFDLDDPLLTSHLPGFGAPPPGSGRGDLYQAVDYVNRDVIPDSIENDLIFQKHVDTITLRPIRYPVVDTHGHIFERASIISWIRINPTCPLDRRPLRVGDLREETNLRRVIENRLRYYEREVNAHVTRITESSADTDDAGGGGAGAGAEARAGYFRETK